MSDNAIEEQPPDAGTVGSEAPAVRESVPLPRRLERYRREIVPSLQKAFGYRNALAVPRLVKIVLNMGVAAAIQEEKRLKQAQEDLARIAGQWPSITRARKSVSAFRLREGQPIGCRVTLRRYRMYEFLDRLVAVAIPRIRDFRGLNPKGMDGRGNYSMGIAEQLVFPEVPSDRVDHVQGMDIAIVTTAKSDQEGLALLKAFGMPFRGETGGRES